MKPRTPSYAMLVALLTLAIFGGIAHAATAVAPQASAGYSAPVLFNRANAFAREGKPGMAVLNYERARLLAPTDPDIRANLQYVRESSGLPAVSGSWLARCAEIANPNTLYWLGCSGLVLTGLSALVGRMRPRRRLVLRSVAIVGVALVAVGMCDAIALRAVLSEAVVIVQAAPARAAPVTVDEPLFTIPEAEIVTMNAERGDFALVQTNTGRQGWVPRSDLAPIVPRDVQRPASS